MKNFLLVIIILFVSMARIIPHPPNFTPLIAIGIFGGAYLGNYKSAVIITVLGMFFSDIIIGFHSMMFWIYCPLILITICGAFLKGNITYNIIYN